MALYEFSIPRLKGYMYDDMADQVVSFKRDPSGAYLAWKFYQGNRSITLSINGMKEHFSRDRLKAYLVMPKKTPAKSVLAATDNLAVSLRAIAPSEEYIMFSKKIQCSQYFFANTNLEMAFLKFKARGMDLDPNEVRILIVNTGAVYKITTVPVTSYRTSLVLA